MWPFALESWTFVSLISQLFISPSRLGGILLVEKGRKYVVSKFWSCAILGGGLRKLQRCDHLHLLKFLKRPFTPNLGYVTTCTWFWMWPSALWWNDVLMTSYTLNPFFACLWVAFSSKLKVVITVHLTAILTESLMILKIFEKFKKGGPNLKKYFPFEFLFFESSIGKNSST